MFTSLLRYPILQGDLGRCWLFLNWDLEDGTIFDVNKYRVLNSCDGDPLNKSKRVLHFIDLKTGLELESLSYPYLCVQQILCLCTVHLTVITTLYTICIMYSVHWHSVLSYKDIIRAPQVSILAWILLTLVWAESQLC